MYCFYYNEIKLIMFKTVKEDEEEVEGARKKKRKEIIFRKVEVFNLANIRSTSIYLTELNKFYNRHLLLVKYSFFI